MIEEDVKQENNLLYYVDDKAWNFFIEGLDGEQDKGKFPIPFFQIIGLFAEDCDYNLFDCHTNRNTLFVKGINHEEEECELMLRYRNVRNRLVVACVQFINCRQGKMQELYRILQVMQKKYNIDEIMIESVMTDEMKNWCIKNGFEKVKGKRNYVSKGAM